MALKKEPKNMTGCMLNAIQTGDQQLMKTLLNTFIHQDGATNYLQLVRVPTSERIVALAETNRKEVHQIIAAQIEYSMKFFNIPNGLNIEQIFLLADTIIDDAGSDNISLQDIFLFLQKLSLGKMGTIYNRLDIPTFMELFEVHRQERHDEIIKFREEEAIQHNALPVNDRLADMFPDNEKDEMRNAMKDYLRKK
jgi:hypothetical protein